MIFPSPLTLRTFHGCCASLDRSLAQTMKTKQPIDLQIVPAAAARTFRQVLQTKTKTKNEKPKLYNINPSRYRCDKIVSNAILPEQIAPHGLGNESLQAA